MTIPILGPYIAPFKPLNNITPFTYRDGMTYLEILEGMRRYVNESLIPFVNDNFNELGDDFETQVNILLTEVNQAVAQILDDSIVVQDPVVAALIADIDSQTRIAMELAFNSDATFTALIEDDASDTRVALETLYGDAAQATVIEDDASDTRVALETLYGDAAQATVIEDDASDTNTAIDTAVALFVANNSSDTSNALDNIYPRKSTLNVKDFGAIGDGIADETVAFNAAIAVANALAGSDRENIIGVTILIPDGRYKLTTNLNPITVSAATIKGESRTGTVLLISATGALFTYGDATRVRLPLGFGISNMKIEYLADPGAAAIFLKVDYGFEVIIEDIQTVRIRTLVSCGTTSLNIAGGVTVRNVRGSQANIAGPLFDLKYGGGFNAEGVATFIRGVLPPIHPAAITTLANVNVMNIIGANWDSVQMNNCFFERYDYGIAIVATSGSVAQNIFISNTIFDYLKTSCIYAESQTGGVISTIRVVNTWIASWEGNAIHMHGAGYNDFHDIDAVIAISGLCSMYYDIATAKHNIFKLTVASNNRVGTAAGAIYFVAGSKGFTLHDSRGNEDNGVGTWRNAYAVTLGADCDDYIITGCHFVGSTSAFSLAANTAGSSKRKIYNNSQATPYSGYIVLAAPATGVTLTNTTAHVWNIDIIGGTVTAISHNGTTLTGMTHGGVRMMPGDTLVITHSVAPSVFRFVDA